MIGESKTSAWSIIYIYHLKTPCIFTTLLKFFSILPTHFHHRKRFSYPNIQYVLSASRALTYVTSVCDGERQVTQPTSPLQSCRSRIGFRHSRSRSKAVISNTTFCHISKGIISCIRERQLWSGNESVEIRYVDGSFVAEISAASPGFHRHMIK